MLVKHRPRAHRPGERPPLPMPQLDGAWTSVVHVDPSPRWGFTFPLAGIPLDEQGEACSLLAEAGSTDLWAAEAGRPDGLTSLAAAAVWVPQMRLGTGVVHAWPGAAGRLRCDDGRPRTGPPFHPRCRHADGTPEEGMFCTVLLMDRLLYGVHRIDRSCVAHLRRRPPRSPVHAISGVPGGSQLGPCAR
jgi:hypothetical protein